MRIQPHEHALDGVLQERAVVDLLDVALADLVEDVGEGAQLVEGQAPVVRLQGGLGGAAEQDRGEGGGAAVAAQ